MKAQIKSDFEKYLISLMQKDTIGYYLTVDSVKVYVYFEGQTIKPMDAYINVTFAPTDTQRVATDTIYHDGFIRMYTYAKNVLFCDKVGDYLSSILNEKTIDITGQFRIELELFRTKQRGNKFAGMDYFENIFDLDFAHWEHATR